MSHDVPLKKLSSSNSAAWANIPLFNTAFQREVLKPQPITPTSGKCPRSFVDLLTLLPTGIAEPTSIPATVFRASPLTNSTVCGGMSLYFVANVNSANCFAISVPILCLLFRPPYYGADHSNGLYLSGYSGSLINGFFRCTGFQCISN